MTTETTRCFGVHCDADAQIIVIPERANPESIFHTREDGVLFFCARCFTENLGLLQTVYGKKTIAQMFTGTELIPAVN